MKVNKKKNKGQTLVELVLALAVVVSVVVALIALATSALRNAQEAVRKAESSKLANAGVEAALYYKNFLGFEDTFFPQSTDENSDDYSKCYKLETSGQSSQLSPDGVTCRDHPENWVVVQTPGTNLTYYRQIKIEKVKDNELLVTSSVAWEDPQGFRRVTVPRKMTNWRTK